MTSYNDYFELLKALGDDIKKGIGSSVADPSALISLYGKLTELLELHSHLDVLLNISFSPKELSDFDLVAKLNSEIRLLVPVLNTVKSLTEAKTEILALGTNETISIMTDLYNNIININAIKNKLPELLAIKVKLTEIDLVATNIAPVNTVATNIEAIKSVNALGLDPDSLVLKATAVVDAKLAQIATAVGTVDPAVLKVNDSITRMTTAKSQYDAITADYDIAKVLDSTIGTKAEWLASLTHTYFSYTYDILNPNASIYVVADKKIVFSTYNKVRRYEVIIEGSFIRDFEFTKSDTGIVLTNALKDGETITVREI